MRPCKDDGVDMSIARRLTKEGMWTYPCTFVNVYSTGLAMFNFLA